MPSNRIHRRLTIEELEPRIAPATVWVNATDANAAEAGSDMAVFTVSRDDTLGNLAVNYSVGGSARNGADYTTVSGAVTIGAGAASATVTVAPIDDARPEPPETVILRLSTSGTYTMGAPDRGTVTIADNDPALPRAATWVETNAGSATGDGISHTASNSYFPRMANGSDGNPIIAWAEDLEGDGDGGEIYVRRWTGSTWAEFSAGSASGGGISANAGNSDWPSVAVAPDGRVFIAWFDDTSGNYEVYLKQWDGSSWVAMGGSGSGGGISQTATGSHSPMLSLGTDGNPIVTWAEDVGAWGLWGGEIYVKKWNGASWVEMSAGSASGSGISGSPNDLSLYPFIVSDTNGNPLISWSEDLDYDGWGDQIYLKRWNGAAWVEMGGSATLGGVSNTADDSEWSPMVMGRDGNPIIAWYDFSYWGVPQIYVRRWDGSAWVEMGPHSASTIGISESAYACWTPSLSLGADGNPIVAWMQDTDNDFVGDEVYVKAFTNNQWVEYDAGSATQGGISGNAGYSEMPWLIVDGTGTAMAAWADNTSGNYEIYVRKYTGVTVWIEETLPTVAEAGPYGLATVHRTGSTAAPLVVSYIAGGQATAGMDYVTLPGTVTIGAGQATATITVTPYDDAIEEPDEGVFISLSTSGSYTVGSPATAVVTITDGGWELWVEVGEGSARDGGISDNAYNSIWPRMVIGTDGNPIIAWAEDTNHDSRGDEIYVKRWTGATWEEMGSGSASGGGLSNDAGHSDWPGIALGADGNPIVTWFDDTSGNSEIYVKRWNGTSWVEMGANSASNGGISHTLLRSLTPSIAVGADGVPVIAWAEDTDGDTWEDEVYARQWNGSSWVGIGGSDTGNGISQSPGPWSIFPFVVIGNDNRPMVTWSEDWDYDLLGNAIYVKRFDGASWVEIGSGSASGTGISQRPGVNDYSTMALNTDGNPIIAWDGWVDPAVADIYVRTWNGSSWVELGGSGSGGGISNNAGWSLAPSIGVGELGWPVVVWYDGSTQTNWEIYVRRWNGASWVEMGAWTGSLGGLSGKLGLSAMPVVAIGTGGEPFVAWSGDTMTDMEIYVRRYDGPILRVTATDPTASETGPDTGTFTLYRTGNTFDPVFVNYDMEGTATNGTDYGNLSGAVTIGAGTRTIPAVVWPISDGQYEGSETAILTLSTQGDYIVSRTHHATVTIADGNSEPPTGVDLLAASDTGVSDTDNLTNLDNSAPGKTLTFRVSGTVAGATVNVYANGFFIGTATAGGAQTDVATNGTVDVADGARTITARQALPGTAESANSPGLGIVIDTAPPTVYSYIVANVTTGGGTTHPMTVTYSDVSGLVVSTLDSLDLRVTGPGGYNQLAAFDSVAPLGDGTPRTAQYHITPPGGAWSPDDSGTYTILLEAGQATDLAGNISGAGTLGTFTVSLSSQMALSGNTSWAFYDGDGSLVNVAMYGPGSGYLTLTNGLLTGAPVDEIVLNNTTATTTLNFYSTGGTVPGTTVNILNIQKAASAGAALSRLGGYGMDIAAGGSAYVDSAVDYFTLRNTWTGAGLFIGGNLNVFDAAAIGDGFIMGVTGNLVRMKAQSIGDDANVNVFGDVTSMIATMTTIGTGGQFMVSGQLAVFYAATMGDGLSLDVSGDMNYLSALRIGNGLSVDVTGHMNGFYTQTLGDNAGITTGSYLTSFQARTIGNGLSLNVGGTMGDFSTYRVGDDLALTVAGNLSTFLDYGNIGTGGDISVLGSINNFRAYTVGDGLALNVGGNLSSIQLEALGAGSEINAGGSVTTVWLQNGSVANGTLSAGQGIGNVTINAGGYDGTVRASGAAGIALLNVRGGNLTGTVSAPNGNITTVKVNGDANVTVQSGGTMGAFALVGGSAGSPRTVSGLFDVKVLNNLSGSYTNLVNLSVRAAEKISVIGVQHITSSLFSARNTIEYMWVSGNVTGSTIMAGYDVGSDGLLGTGDDTAGDGTGAITYLQVSGNVASSSIAAGINPGPDLMFGSADDTSGAASTVGTGISTVIIMGTLTGSANPGEKYGILAHRKINGITVGGSGLILPYVFGNITIAQYWR